MDADRGNAHIRPTSTRQSDSVAAVDAERLLNDPAFIRARDIVHAGLIRQIEDGKDDGSDAFADNMLEVCRSLRTLKCISRNLSLAMQRPDLVRTGEK